MWRPSRRKGSSVKKDDIGGVRTGGGGKRENMVNKIRKVSWLVEMLSTGGRLGEGSLKKGRALFQNTKGLSCSTGTV